MKPVMLFIDDDSNILDAVGPHIRSVVADRIQYVVELQSKNEVDEFIENPKDRLPVVAVIDLWFNDFITNTADQEAGFIIVDRLLKSFKKIHLIVFSAHLTPDRTKRLKDAFPSVVIISKGEGAFDSLLSEIDLGLKSYRI